MTGRCYRLWPCRMERMRMFCLVTITIGSSISVSWRLRINDQDPSRSSPISPCVVITPPLRCLESPVPGKSTQRPCCTGRRTWLDRLCKSLSWWWRIVHRASRSWGRSCPWWPPRGLRSGGFYLSDVVVYKIGGKGLVYTDCLGISRILIFSRFVRGVAIQSCWLLVLMGV